MSSKSLNNYSYEFYLEYEMLSNLNFLPEASGNYRWVDNG